MSALLEVIDLKKSYGDLVALAGVSFQVHAGEVFGLLGPNGAGKTTLLSILSCLAEPGGGEVLLMGQRLRSVGEQKRLLGIVPQELAIYEALTARENLVFFGELYGLGGKELRVRVESLLTAVGLEGRAADRVATFSGGMKRRLNLAVALVHSPRLLLLDEPTVGVDPQSRNLIFEEVRRLNGEGMTVVYTSHYMEEVAALCQRVGIIDQGRLLACDTLANLLQTLRGLVRCKVAAMPPALRAELGRVEGCTLRETGPAAFELECHDVNSAVVRVVTLLSEHQVALVHLETQEPNLERVFLDMTGRALRD